MLEIFDQGGASLVGVLTVLFEVSDEVAVLVPGFVEDFDEAHATLDQPPREQTSVREGSFAWLGAIHFEGLLRFLGKIH